MSSHLKVLSEAVGQLNAIDADVSAHYILGQVAHALGEQLTQEMAQTSFNLAELDTQRKNLCDMLNSMRMDFPHQLKTILSDYSELLEPSALDEHERLAAQTQQMLITINTQYADLRPLEKQPQANTLASRILTVKRVQTAIQEYHDAIEPEFKLWGQVLSLMVTPKLQASELKRLVEAEHGLLRNFLCHLQVQKKLLSRAFLRTPMSLHPEKVLSELDHETVIVRGVFEQSEQSAQFAEQTLGQVKSAFEKHIQPSVLKLNALKQRCYDASKQELSRTLAARSRSTSDRDDLAISQGLVEAFRAVEIGHALSQGNSYKSALSELSSESDFKTLGTRLRYVTESDNFSWVQISESRESKLSYLKAWQTDRPVQVLSEEVLNDHILRETLNNNYTAADEGDGLAWREGVSVVGSVGVNSGIFVCMSKGGQLAAHSVSLSDNELITPAMAHQAFLQPLEETLNSVGASSGIARYYFAGGGPETLDACVALAYAAEQRRLIVPASRLGINNENSYTNVLVAGPVADRPVGVMYTASVYVPD